MAQDCQERRRGPRGCPPVSASPSHSCLRPPLPAQRLTQREREAARPVGVCSHGGQHWPPGGAPLRDIRLHHLDSPPTQPPQSSAAPSATTPVSSHGFSIIIGRIIALGKLIILFSLFLSNINIRTELGGIRPLSQSLLEQERQIKATLNCRPFFLQKLIKMSCKPFTETLDGIIIKYEVQN